MSRREAIGGAAAALVCFLAFFLSGVPLFHRGPMASACFILSGVAFNAGVFFAKASAPAAPPATAPQAQAAPPPPQGVNLEAFGQLSAKVDFLEKKINGMAFVAGMRSRRGPVMPSASAPESPK
jgi:hypothetical protein